MVLSTLGRWVYRTLGVASLGPQEFLQPVFREDQREPAHRGRELTGLPCGAVLPCPHG